MNDGSLVNKPWKHLFTHFLPWEHCCVRRLVKGFEKAYRKGSCSTQGL